MTASHDLEYPYGNCRLNGVVFGKRAGASRAGIVVFPDAMGIGDHVLQRAEALADKGYVTLAADMYGERLRPGDSERALQLLATLRADVSTWRGRANAALNALAAVSGVDNGRLGAIGFCFGGSTCLELARSGARLQAVVCFHGGLETTQPAQRGSISARIMICTGSQDSRVPLSQIPAFLDEMSAAIVDCEVVIYSGTQHSFTNPGTHGLPGMAYSERADRRSWAAMLGFFNEHLHGNRVS